MQSPLCASMLLIVSWTVAAQEEIWRIRATSTSDEPPGLVGQLLYRNLPLDSCGPASTHRAN